jgi:hypothetical protein
LTLPFFYDLQVDSFNSKTPAGYEVKGSGKVDIKMNTQTLVLTVLIFWLIMGLGFTSTLSEVRRQGGTFMAALKTNEAFFFILSVISGIFIIIYKVSSV